MLASLIRLLPLRDYLLSHFPVWQDVLGPNNNEQFFKFNQVPYLKFQ